MILLVGYILLPPNPFSARLRWTRRFNGKSTRSFGGTLSKAKVDSCLPSSFAALVALPA